ncbi:hypothetical protein LPJ75_005257, partial [Coemansia sp. RSA 2598]
YPVEGFVNCTLTKNIRTLQKILTFINEYLGGVDLPRVDEDVLYSPAMKLLKPVNKTVDALRLVVVGTFVPNATLLDPDWFQPESELESDLDAYESSLESVEDERERSEDSLEDMLDSLEDASEDSEDSVEDSEDGDVKLQFNQGQSVTSDPSAAGAADAAATTDAGAQLRKRAESDGQPESGNQDAAQTPADGQDSAANTDANPDANPDANSDANPDANPDANSAAGSGTDSIETVDSLPDSSSLLSSLSSSPLPSSLPSTKPTRTASEHDTNSELGELDNLDDELSSLGIDPSSFPTMLSKEQVETAQKYGGYTGGLVGMLCDYYVGNLLDQIPSFIALIGVWVVLIIFGLFHVFSDYRKISRYGLDRMQHQQQQQYQQQQYQQQQSYNEKRFH